MGSIGQYQNLEKVVPSIIPRDGNRMPDIMDIKQFEFIKTNTAVMQAGLYGLMQQKIQNRIWEM